MQLSAGILALFALEGVAAFTAGGAKAAGLSSRSTPVMSGWDMKTITPDGSLMQRVEGKSRRTWKFTNLAKDRVQVALTSEGRPVNADVQLWLGPNWTPFSMTAYSEDGNLRPIQTLVGTRNKEATIEVRNNGAYEFPFKAASNYAEGEMETLPAEIPGDSAGVRVDGGAIRSFPVSADTTELELVLNTDGRQLNAKIELLNAPNNPKQTYECFTNNGMLNCLCVAFKTPDPGTTIRVINRAEVEFPCYIHCNALDGHAHTRPPCRTLTRRASDDGRASHRAQSRSRRSKHNSEHAGTGA
jgi:hypothetical protein